MDESNEEYFKLELTDGQLLGEEPKDTVNRLKAAIEKIASERQSILDIQDNIQSLIDELSDAINTLPPDTKFIVRPTEGYKINIYSLETDRKTGFIGFGAGFAGKRYSVDTPNDTLMVVSGNHFIMVDVDNFLETYDIEVELPATLDQLDN